MTDTPNRPVGRKLPGWVVATPMVLAALCLLAILPWLLHAPEAPSARYVAGRTTGAVVLVAYPVLLVSVLMVIVWLKERKVDAVRQVRWLFWLLFLAFVAGTTTALVLMFGP